MKRVAVGLGHEATESSTDYQRAVAFHEAGHCWGYWAIGRRFRYATLRPRTAGFDAVTRGYRGWEWDELHGLAIVASSGPVAELLHRIDRDPVRPDLEEHLQTVFEGGHSDVPRSGGILKDATRVRILSDIIDGHWVGVAQVAAELLEDRTLSGKRVFGIFDATAPEHLEASFRALWSLA